MEQRANFLALTLLDALEDENEADILSMLDRNLINAGIVPCDRGLAPLHYVCGMRNEELARRILEKFLECPDLDVDALCDGQTTALHIASIYGRVDLVRMLLQRGARVDLADDENKLPVHYAIEECHFEVLQLLRDHIFREKQKQKNSLRLQLPHHQAATTTPNQILKYNYDVTSPYYINITHRRQKPQPKFPDIADSATLPDEESVNLFALTEAHLTQLIQSQYREDPDNPKRRSIIESWREKVERSRARQSLMHKYDKHVEAIVEEALAHDDFNYERLMHKKLREEDSLEMEMELKQQQIDDASAPNRQVFQKLVEQVSQAQVIEAEPDNSFVTAKGEEELLVNSPRPTDEYFLQIKEAYVHTDDENGLVFYEAKFLQNDENRTKRFVERVTQQQQQQQLDSTVSTNLTLPLDYETDALRRELTQLGAPVGPITKTTKRLYIKQLIKYRRNTDALLAAQKHAQESQIRYSVELHRTLRSPEDFERISEFMPQEAASSEHFATAPVIKKTLREGHLKQSFIYMLIDPRISRNLPGESTFLDKFSIWQRFLDSIFYVGKGKSSRPYAHLYDAMRQHTRLNQKRENGRERTERAERKGGFRTLQPDVFKSPPAGDAKLGSKKLERILEIWQSENGVVCLHVFHNIMPIDAYTREASIIDAMGLGHLTNLKRGDYYGPAQSWTMKQRKHLGIALLYKAMHIYLAEGESQLSPSDLI
ncbi:uncharacterized protein LOC108163087 [Drosophila miranda]|uniref:uncharacterized protein LOC108163087 n=1 Tax=Drosophila miranda TaxID=7229 RepID=UPI0007E6FF95|nr:uncharacterized protein LOC108163087 [Drosophila miranda]